MLQGLADNHSRYHAGTLCVRDDNRFRRYKPNPVALPKARWPELLVLGKNPTGGACTNFIISNYKLSVTWPAQNDLDRSDS